MKEKRTRFFNGKNRKLFLALLVFLLMLILSISTVLYFQFSVSFKKTPTIVSVSNGRTGSFFFDSENEVHIPYYQYSTETASKFGWLTAKYGNLKCKIDSYFDLRTETERGLGLFSNVKGAYSGGQYFLFSNGIDAFFNLGSVGQVSTNLEQWIPAPTFSSTTKSQNFSRFVGLMEGSPDNLTVCFSDFQGFITGISNYSFYFLNLSGDDTFIEEITFSGDLDYLGDAQFFLFRENPAICWSFYDDILDLVTLKISLKEDNTWYNFTMSYPSKDLYPCGFDTHDGSLRVYYYGLNYFGSSDDGNFNGTTLYQTLVTTEGLIPTPIFSYPHRLHFPEQSIHQWDNGDVSLLYQQYNSTNSIAYYGLYSEGHLEKSIIQLNPNSTWTIPIQFAIQDNYIHVLWKESFPISIPESSTSHSLYFARLPLDTDFLLDNTQIIEHITWIDSKNTLYVLCTKRRGSEFS
ncbi:MAG: hypothetical protein ACTSVO_14090 [Candidatus Heimdallarchaeaceae archaeon]